MAAAGGTNKLTVATRSLMCFSRFLPEPDEKTAGRVQVHPKSRCSAPVIPKSQDFQETPHEQSIEHSEERKQQVNRRVDKL